MEKRIGLIHATLNALQPMLDAFQRYEPAATALNFLDEGLLGAVNEQGGVTPEIVRRFMRLIEKAEEAKVDGILLSCTVFSPHVPLLRQFFSIPIVTVDGAMLEQAVNMGGRIGVIATVAAAGPTTAKQIEEIARQRGKNVQVDVTVCTEAFSKLQIDPLVHDQLIRKIALNVAAKADIIVLAQISMARAAVCMEDVTVPVLTSPQSSIQAIMQQIGNR